MAAISTITGDFSQDPPWVEMTGAVANSQDPTRVEIDMATQSNRARAAFDAGDTTGFDLTNSSFSWKNHAFGTAGSHSVELRASDAAGSQLRIIGNVSSDSNNFTVTNGGTTVGTFTVATGKANPFWRWRHTGGNVIFEYDDNAAFSSPT